MAKTDFQCSQWAQGLENHAAHLTNSSSMSVTTCFRYVLTFVFDGLAFGVWGRRGSYMRKLLRLHYMGNWKNVIMPNQTFYQKRYTWRLDSPIKPFLRISLVRLGNRHNTITSFRDTKIEQRSLETGTFPKTNIENIYESEVQRNEHAPHQTPDTKS